MGELPNWPQLFTPAVELRGWLDEQARLHQRDPVVSRHLRTIRWLVLAELDRKSPEGFKPGLPISPKG